MQLYYIGLSYVRELRGGGGSAYIEFDSTWLDVLKAPKQALKSVLEQRLVGTILSTPVNCTGET